MNMRTGVVRLTVAGWGLLAAGGCMDRVVARAGPDRTVYGGATVTLDGTASQPEKRNRRSLSWEVLEGPEVALADASAEVTTFTAPRQAEDSDLRIRLTVTYVDYAGQPVADNNDTDEVLVHVLADPNLAAEGADAGSNGAGDSTTNGTAGGAPHPATPAAPPDDTGTGGA